MPLSTTLPIFIGGLIKGIADWQTKRSEVTSEESELSKGNLFATGLVAGGALMGVIGAILVVAVPDFMDLLNIEKSLHGALSTGGYYILGVACFAFMAYRLYRLALK
jgi:hypothetical protein